MAQQVILIFIGLAICSARVLDQNQRGLLPDTPVLKSQMDSPGKHGNHLNVPVEHIGTGQTQLLGPLVSGTGSVGESVGMALLNHQNKTSHIDPPGVHNNFLDIPVEHVVTDQGPHVGSHNVPLVTGSDYMSSLVQSYGRTRQKPTLEQTVNEVIDSSVSPLELKLSQLLKDIQVDLSVPVSMSETNLEPNTDVLAGSSNVKDPRVTSVDYMSSLVQAYGRIRKLPTFKKQVKALLSDIDSPLKRVSITNNPSKPSITPSALLSDLSPLELKLSHLLKDIQVDLSVPVSLSETNQGPNSLDVQQGGSILAAGSTDITDPKVTGVDYISSLVQAYGRRSGQTPTHKQIVNEVGPSVIDSPVTPLELKLSNLLKDIQVDLSVPVSMSETNLDPNRGKISGSSHPKVTSVDYMSSLVQAYGRIRKLPTFKQKVKALLSDIDSPLKRGSITDNPSKPSITPSELLPEFSPLELKLSHLLKDIQVDLSVPVSLSETNLEPNVLSVSSVIKEPKFTGVDYMSSLVQSYGRTGKQQ